MQLKSPYKEVAYAHFCKELSVPEIAQQTGKNPKTVQTQLYRARAMLKKMLLKRPESERSTEEKGLLAAYDRPVDFTDRAALAPLIAWCRDEA